jgi:thioredoxin reductase
MMQNYNELPIVILGAGPVGLAAAAHLANRNMPFQLIEAGEKVGNNILSWGHVRLFSPWRYNIDKIAEQLLLKEGWKIPNKDELPTGTELVNDYLLPLSQHPSIAPHISLNTEVLNVGRKGIDKTKSAERTKLPFQIDVRQNGKTSAVFAKAVIDATGTWNQPNPIISGGTYTQTEKALRPYIYYGIPEVLGQAAERYRNKNVLVIGSGHSAINVLLELAKLQELYPETKLNWVLRKQKLSTVYGGKSEDALEARGALGTAIEQLVESGKLNVYTPFYVNELNRNHKGIRLIGEQGVIEGIDEIICNTGSRPNLDVLREVRIDLDASLEAVFDLADLIDPNIHSCGTVRPHGEAMLRHPEDNFYIVGAKSYGRAPTFLMATGYEQVRSTVAYLAGDHEAAKRVELDLPETGVCSSDNEPNGAACCSTPTEVKEQCC